jgi:S-adenosylmethionine hydrolase
MKGVILGIAPDARLVDLTHEVPPQDVVAGAHLLASAVRWFPRGTIHIAVVDPGVGTRRRALVVETDGGRLVGPDNGLLSLAAPARAVRAIHDVSRSPVRLRPVSRTFHGRDVFAPVAAHLAAGTDAATLGLPARAMQRLRPPRVRRRGATLVGTVLWVDRFGNLATNVHAADLAAAGLRGRSLSVRIRGHVLRFGTAYASVAVGKATALVNSADLLEIAVNRGSAAALLGAAPGTPVVVGRR